MAWHGKRVRKAYEGLDRDKSYPIPDAVKMVKSRATTTYNPSTMTTLAKAAQMDALPSPATMSSVFTT